VPSLAAPTGGRKGIGCRLDFFAVSTHLTPFEWVRYRKESKLLDDVGRSQGLLGRLSSGQSSGGALPGLETTEFDGVPVQASHAASQTCGQFGQAVPPALVSASGSLLRSQGPWLDEVCK
jgi:hypothetical protein